MGILDAEKIENKPSVTEVWNGIKNINKQTYENTIAGLTSAFNAVWNNQFYSAKEIFSEAGEDALKLVQTSQALQQFLAFVNPEFVELSPNCPIEVTAEGKVIVGDPFPPPVVEETLPQEPPVVTLPEETVTE